MREAAERASRGMRRCSKCRKQRPLEGFSAELDMHGPECRRVDKLRFGPGQDRTTIIVNSHLTLRGIPKRAYDYVVDGRPAIEWVMDRYQVRVDKDSGIVNDPNTYSADPRYIVYLIKRVITVSLKTLDVVDQLRAAEVGILAA